MAEPKPTSTVKPNWEPLPLPERPSLQSKLPKAIWNVKNGAATTAASSTSGVSASPTRQSMIRPDAAQRSVTAPSRIPKASGGTNQSSSSNEFPKVPTSKPLPSPPVAEIGNGSPPAVGRTIIDAFEQHTPQLWPALVPTPPESQPRSEANSSRATDKKPSYLDLKRRNQQYVNLQSPRQPKLVHSTTEASTRDDMEFSNPRPTSSPPSLVRSHDFYIPASFRHESETPPPQQEIQDVPTVTQFDPTNSVESLQASPVSRTSSESSLDFVHRSQAHAHIENSPARRLNLRPTLTVFTGADKMILGEETPPPRLNVPEPDGVRIDGTDIRVLPSYTAAQDAGTAMGELTATPGYPVPAVLGRDDMQRRRSEANPVSIRELRLSDDSSPLPLPPPISTWRIETSLTPRAVFNPQGHLPTGDLTVASRPFPRRISSLEQTSTSPAVHPLPEILRKSRPGPSSLRHSHTPSTISVDDPPTSPTDSVSSARNNSGTGPQTDVARASVCNAGHGTAVTSIAHKKRVATRAPHRNEHNKEKTITTTNRTQLEVSRTSATRPTGKRHPRLRSNQGHIISDAGSPLRRNGGSRSPAAVNKNTLQKRSPISGASSRQDSGSKNAGTMTKRPIAPLPVSTTNKIAKARTNQTTDSTRDAGKPNRLIEKAKRLIEKAQMTNEGHEKLKMMEVASAMTATAKSAAQAEQHRIEAENHAKLAAYAAEGAQLHLKRAFELMGEHTGLLGKVQAIWRSIRH